MMLIILNYFFSILAFVWPQIDAKKVGFGAFEFFWWMSCVYILLSFIRPMSDSNLWNWAPNDDETYVNIQVFSDAFVS